MNMQKGKLYQTTKALILYLDYNDFDWSKVPEIDIKLDSVTVAATPRKLRAHWAPKKPQDFGDYYGTISGSPYPVQKGTYCEVPKGWIVMYVETASTGHYKLICGDFIGWTAETFNLLEEVNLVVSG